MQTLRLRRAVRAIALVTRSLKRARLARPVSASWNAWWASCASSSLGSVMSLIVITIPFRSVSWRRFAGTASTMRTPPSRQRAPNSMGGCSPGLATRSEKYSTTGARSSSVTISVIGKPSSSPGVQPSTVWSDGMW